MGPKVVTYDRFRENREKVAAEIIGDSGNRADSTVRSSDDHSPGRVQRALE
jgi:hypothetical protein